MKTTKRVKPKVRTGKRSAGSLHGVVLRLCPNCEDLTAQPEGSIDQYSPNGKGGWDTVTVMQMWNCPKCNHDFAEWKPQNDKLTDAGPDAPGLA